MHIILCLDISPNTKNVLEQMKQFVQSLNMYKVSVIHIIDEGLFAAGTGFEQQLFEYMQNDSAQLKKLCHEYLGNDMHYIEEFGIPGAKIDAILSNTEYDLLAIGSHSRSILGIRLLGSVSEHLLRNSYKPVLVIK